MAVVRSDSSRELDSLQGEVNRLFDTFFTPQRAPRDVARRWLPAMDVLEMEDDWVLRLDVPGMSEQELEIDVADGMLTVSGSRTSAREEDVKGWHRSERAAGRFERQVQLPRDIDVDSVGADLANGVLEIRVPKPAQRKPRRIEVRRGDAVQHDIEAGAAHA